ncbi:MAG: hypothetical protein IJ769_02975 [Clostridia bacterium]|nr:hypothetical protein [Clostridia bacterium]
MKHRWMLAWAIQIAEMLAVGLLAALSYAGSAILYGALLWGATPLAGLFTACQAVLRGLNNYAAWLAPAPCLFAAHYLLWGFSPSIGAALLTAFLSLVGAAAGEVLSQRRPKGGRGRR